MDQLEMKKLAARAALKYVKPDTIVGVGSGSTVNCFIEALGELKDQIQGAVAASKASEELLRKQGIEALTREKIVAALAKKFICIVDASKQVDVLGSTFPLPVEVIPMARSQVGRKLVSLGGAPEYREGVVTDNGNVILDVHNFAILNPVEMEKELNNVAGVVTNGIFALRGADIVIVGTPDGAKIID